MPRGGHFAALEQPDLWLDDVRAFVQQHVLPQLQLESRAHADADKSEL